MINTSWESLKVPDPFGEDALNGIKDTITTI